jgi:tRNA pseudouridine38-40 synthase
MEVLTRCLKRFEGYHDFRAFAGGLDQLERKLGASMDTWRSVYSVDIVDEGHGLYRIDVVLKGALYKMIRNMVGTALHVAYGKMDEGEFNKLIDQQDGLLTRFDNPCKPAPPEGLTLERVYFEDY